MSVQVSVEAEATLRLALSLSGEVGRGRALSRRLRAAAAAALAQAEAQANSPGETFRAVPRAPHTECGTKCTRIILNMEILASNQCIEILTYSYVAYSTFS